MPTISIGNKLEEERTPFIFDGPLACEPNSLGGGYNVHAVNLEARNLVAAGKVRGVGGTTLGGSAHAVLVILADEDGWEVPKLSLDIR